MAKNRRPKYTARTADCFVLYQEAVQAAKNDTTYIDRLYKQMRNRRAHALREDFCGTAALSCEWVKQHREHRAIAVDLDATTLAWGKAHNVSELNDSQRERLTLVNDNVLHISRPKVDIVVAFNFSYFIFKTREQLRRYFQTVYKSLAHKGMFLIDVYGGSEAQEVLKERRRCKGFTYVWEHASFNPLTSETLCHIHFEFPDGSRMRKAFSYDWRLWSLTELQEVLLESGFSHVEVHWEGTNHKTGEGNGRFRKTIRGEAIESWIAYIVALV